MVSLIPMNASLISGGWRPSTFLPNGPNSANPVFESSCSKYEANWSLGSGRYSMSILIGVLITSRVEERDLPSRSILPIDRRVVGNRKFGDAGHRNLVDN